MMIGYLPPQEQTGDCWCHESSTDLQARIARHCGAAATLSGSAIRPLCRHDFLETLRLLGTRRNDRRLRCADHARLMFPVHVSCPYEQWVAIVGLPEDLKNYKTPSMHTPVSVWKQSCIDGPVTCIGHVFQRGDGERWVTVVRVGMC